MFDGLTWPKIKSPAPPSCYEALTDALSPLEAQNIKAALRTAVTDTLATGDVSSLVEEIKRLGQGALDTERSFYEISSGLKKVDGARSVVPKLQPEWEELRGRYREILQGSRETATKIESHFNHLDGVVFCMISDAINNPRDNGKLDLAIKELAGFNEKPDLSQYTGGQALSTYSQEFTDLRRDVESFLDKLKEIPMKRSFSKHLSDVKDKIVGLGRGIVRCGFVVSAITTAMNIFAIVAGLLDGQDFANITLKTAFAFQADGQSWENKLDGAAPGRKELETIVKSAEDSLGRHRSTIVQSLDNLAGIWSAVSHEALLLRQAIQKAHNSGSPAGLKYHLDHLKKTYKPLKEGLKAYATATDISKCLS